MLDGANTNPRSVTQHRSQSGVDDIAQGSRDRPRSAAVFENDTCVRRCWMQLQLRPRIAVNADAAQCDGALDGALGRKPQHDGRERAGPVQKLKHESSRAA